MPPIIILGLERLAECRGHAQWTKMALMKKRIKNLSQTPLLFIIVFFYVFPNSTSARPLARKYAAKIIAGSFYCIFTQVLCLCMLKVRLCVLQVIDTIYLLQSVCILSPSLFLKCCKNTEKTLKNSLTFPLLHRLNCFKVLTNILEK